MNLVRNLFRGVTDWTMAIGYLLLLFSVGYFRLACHALKSNRKIEQADR